MIFKSTRDISRQADSVYVYMCSFNLIFFLTLISTYYEIIKIISAYVLIEMSSCKNTIHWFFSETTESNLWYFCICLVLKIFLILVLFFSIMETWVMSWLVRMGGQHSAWRMTKYRLVVCHCFFTFDFASACCIWISSAYKCQDVIMGVFWWTRDQKHVSELWLGTCLWSSVNMRTVTGNLFAFFLKIVILSFWQNGTYPWASLTNHWIV